jgi:hypothetical protein
MGREDLIAFAITRGGDIDSTDGVSGYLYHIFWLHDVRLGWTDGSADCVGKEK